MVAIVTGGVKGIGLEIVKRLSEIGYICIATARHNSQVIMDMEGVFFFPCDISSADDRQKLLDFTLQKFGVIDLLVNNAGVAPKERKDMLEITEEDYDYLLDINLKGTYFLTQMVANVMKKKSFGRIINISSVSSYAVSVNRAEYCISKAGISMITKLFASRLAEYNIGVFEIMPGIIKTDMTAGVMDKYTELIANGLTPIKRFGEPKDIANCVEAIAGGKLDFCTGTAINCDGGFFIKSL